MTNQNVEAIVLMRVLIAKGIITYDELVALTKEANEMLSAQTSADMSKISWQTSDEEIKAMMVALAERLATWLKTGVAK